VGFGHVVFDDDRWGSFIENLHVTHDRRRSGIGRALLTCVSGAVVERATGRSLYLWVLEQNTAAQRFYRAMGGTSVEKASVPPPGGVPARLNGSPSMLRFTWPDAESLLAQPGHRRSQTAAGMWGDHVAPWTWASLIMVRVLLPQPA
jgi:hypothetical protein